MDRGCSYTVKPKETIPTLGIPNKPSLLGLDVDGGNIDTDFCEFFLPRFNLLRTKFGCFRNLSRVMSVRDKKSPALEASWGRCFRSWDTSEGHLVTHDLTLPCGALRVSRSL